MFDPLHWRFIGVGLINTLFGLAVIFAARPFVGEFSANAIGYLVVVPLSFLAHRTVSFRDKGNRWSAFARYLPTIAAGYLANLLTLGIGLGLTNAYVAQTAAILSHVTVTYVLSRHFVFREHECSQQK